MSTDRKLEEKHENPIDNILYYFVEKISPILRILNFTPNGITTLSMIFGLASIYMLNKSFFLTAAILYFIAYFFDCVDGYYARKYNQVTVFGDYYDHIKDFAIALLLFYYIFSHNIKNKVIILIILSIFLLLQSIHIGCQEKIYDNGKPESPILDFTQKLCVNPDKNIHITKYFGCGTFALLQSIIIGFFLK